jgi:hypothetical protein
VGVAIVLAGCSGGGTKSVAPATPAALSTSLSAVENFFAAQGTSGWSKDPHYTASDYQVAGTAETNCEVTINGPSGSSTVSSIGVICNPSPSGTIAISVPPNEVNLVKAAVKKFDPSDYSRVNGIRTTASSSEISTAVARRIGSPAVSSAALSLSVDSSPPPGSNMPGLNFSINAVG